MAKQKLPEVVLRYIGTIGDSGPSFIFGVPARDLTMADVEERELDVEALATTGLYEKIGDSKQEVTDGDRV